MFAFLVEMQLVIKLYLVCVIYVTVQCAVYYISGQEKNLGDIKNLKMYDLV